MASIKNTCSASIDDVIHDAMIARDLVRVPIGVFQHQIARKRISYNYYAPCKPRNTTVHLRRSIWVVLLCNRRAQQRGTLYLFDDIWTEHVFVNWKVVVPITLYSFNKDILTNPDTVLMLLPNQLRGCLKGTVASNIVVVGAFPPEFNIRVVSDDNKRVFSSIPVYYKQEYIDNYKLFDGALIYVHRSLLGVL